MQLKLHEVTREHVVLSLGNNPPRAVRWWELREAARDYPDGLDWISSLYRAALVEARQAANAAGLSAWTVEDAGLYAGPYFRSSSEAEGALPALQAEWEARVEDDYGRTIPVRARVRRLDPDEVPEKEDWWAR